MAVRGDRQLLLQLLQLPLYADSTATPARTTAPSAFWPAPSGVIQHRLISPAMDRQQLPGAARRSFLTATLHQSASRSALPSAAGRSSIFSTGAFHCRAADTVPLYAICPTMYTLSSPYLREHSRELHSHGQHGLQLTLKNT